MTETAMFVKLTAADGKREQLLEVLSSMLPAVEGEDGTLLYLLHTDDTDSNVVWMYERYTDADALVTHSSSEAMATLIGSLGELVGDSPMMVQVTPTGGKGA